MHRILSVTLGTLLLAVASPTHAQAPGRPPTGAGPVQLPSANGEIRGSVIDEANGPLARASIAIRSKRDGSLIAGAIATSTGSFRIQGLRPGTYVVRVTSIGFKPNIQEITLTDAASTAAIGSVKLVRTAVALEGVKVLEERNAVSIEPDRNAYRAKDVAPAAGNASEVLDAVPSVQVDGDGKVSLRGNENVAIQINGRPSPIRGAQLGGYLKSLPANIVERIEVIPNPSAKYDPEGMAGIINIVLKQNTDLGLSGGMNAGIANRERYNASGNVGYQSGPFTLFNNIGINSDNRGVVGINDRERYSTSRALLSVTEQDIAQQSANKGQNMSSTLDYKINARDVLSNALTLNFRQATDGMVGAYSELNSSRALLDRYNRLRNNNIRSTMFDYTLGFKRTLEPRKHEIATELRFNRSRDDDKTLQSKLPLTVTGGSAGSAIAAETDNLNALTRQLTGQLDYTRSLAARTKLETGYKGTARWLDRDYDVRKDALGTGAFIPSSLSNAFSFDEKVNAVYGVLSHGIGRFDLQGGLRGEYASRDFTLADKSYPKDYGSLFPSGVVSFNKSDATQMKLSYSRRIRRPGTQELSPFPTFFDAQNVFIGNPKLSPEYTDALEGGLTRSGKFGSVQFSPFYRRTSNVIRVAINTADVIDGREVTSVTFQNLASSNSWGTDLNGQLRLGPKFNGFASFNLFKMVTDGGSTSSLSSDAVLWSYRLNATSQFTPTVTAQASYFYRGPMNIERGRFGSFQQAGMSLRKKIYGEAAAVAIRFVDPFNTGTFKARVGNDNITQITERNFGARATFLSFQYNFGQAPKTRQRPQEQPEQRPGFGT